MKSVFIALLFIAGALSQGYIRSEQRSSVIKTELPKIPKATLPANFTWADVNNTNFLTLVRNQHIPVYCGSCWAFATTSALSDRIKIARNAQWPDIDLAPQVIISCDDLDLGCNGGDPLNAYAYIYNYSVTDETCTNYQARGNTNGLECTEFIRCGTCDPDGTCATPDSYLIYNISEYGEISGESDMMNELFQRGPISCVVDATPLINYTNGIINYTGNYTIDHAVSVVGWGTLPNGTTYWTVRNSWGSYWGEYGFFNIIRGENTLGIETSCVWAVPTDTWTSGARNYTDSSAKHDVGSVVRRVRSAFNKFLPVFRDDLAPRQHPICYKPDPNRDRSIDPETAPWRHIDGNDLPVNFTWQNVNGVNYLSWSKNQHIPQYCGSCWAQAATSVLADRINIGRIRNNQTAVTVAISPQAIINCGAGGDCNGGESMGVYEYAKSNGVVEDSCQNYVAANPPVENCTPIEICKTCIPPAPPAGKDTNVNCSAVTTHPTWKVSSYGAVRGADAMKKEIYANGPISCGMDVTNEFENYSGGIYKQFVLLPVMNHEVSVVGWGTTQAGESYWIVRNSWGTFWGEWGFFQIHMGGENLGIETQCSWAIPIVN